MFKSYKFEPTRIQNLAFQTLIIQNIWQDQTPYL